MKKNIRPTINSILNESKSYDKNLIRNKVEKNNKYILENIISKKYNLNENFSQSNGKNPFFIIESPPILQEGEIDKTYSGKARFKMVLQTADEKNQNRRIYPKSVLSQGINDCQARIKRRAFFGELDHPIPQGNQQYDGIRQSTVLLKELSHIITSVWFEGNLVMGEIETSSTPNGRILHGLLKDRAGIGMSMRGMAELDRREGVSYVKSPLMIFSFDAVSHPSHQSALVDFNRLNFESYNLKQISESKQMICTKDGVCFLPDYFDKLVEKKVIKLRK